ncbi:MAG TPA: CU044_2847 family protein [Glycomyces sp.]|nr:CU044_2847 family protein [Glycomyces sp.]
MRQAVPVTIGSAEFLIETTEAAADADGGIEPIGDDLFDRPETFDRLRETVEAVSAELVAVWQKVRPAEATVEFGIGADVKTGKLTGILVSGGAAASLKVTLKWTDKPEAR